METGPRSGATAEMRRTHFVIASVREPCARLVSAFEYKRQESKIKKRNETKMGQDWKDKEWETFSKKNAPAVYKDFLALHSPADQEPLNELSSIEEIQVDCWVILEALETTLRACLEAFEAQGGSVDYGAMVIESPGTRAKQNYRNVSSYLELRKPTKPLTNEKGECVKIGKNALGGAVHCDDRKSCEERFQDPLLVSQVTVNAGDMYRKFGWEGCCGGLKKDAVVA